VPRSAPSAIAAAIGAKNGWPWFGSCSASSHEIPAAAAAWASCPRTAAPRFARACRARSRRFIAGSCQRGPGSADEAAAELTHHRVLLHAVAHDRDLSAHEPMPALVHLWQAGSDRRQIRQMTDGPADGGAARFVLPPDVVDRLARDRDPPARL